jgi:hypothetical protein
VGVLVVGYSTAADEPPHRPAPTDLVVWHRNADRTAFNSGVDRPTV